MRKVVFIHGVNSRSNVWKVQENAELYEYYKIDLLRYDTIEEYNELLFDYMNAYGIHKATLVGHSFGGFLAINFAHAYPERVHNLVLVNPAGIFPFLGLFGSYISLFFKYFTYINNFMYTSLSEQYWKEPSIHKLLELEMPISLIYGKKDFIVPYYQGEYIHRIQKNTSLDIFENSNHFLDKDILDCVYKRLSYRKRNTKIKLDFDCKKYRSSFNIYKTRTIIRSFFNNVVMQMQPR